MKNLNLIVILFLVSSVAIIGCSKGTAGPKGPAGPAGAGDVQHSAWVTLVTPFAGLDNIGDSLFTDAIPAASITQKVLDSDLVLSYLGLPSGAVIDAADFSSFVDVSYTVGTITLTGINVNFTNQNVLFRYVIVPGATVITGELKKYSREQIKNMSYSTISKLLGITDKPNTN